MAYPDKPQILTSYTAEEQSIGNGTLPGQELDVDFASLKTSQEQVIDFLKLFTRSDGKLANGIVTQEALAPSILIGFDPPTVWATAQAYTTRSTVFQGQQFYLCVIAHTSGVFNTDLSAGRWQLLADLTPVGGALVASNNLSDLADAATARTNLGLGSMASLNSGTSGGQFRTNSQNEAFFQPLDATLTAFAGVTGSADVFPYFTGADAFATAPVTAFARTILDDANAAAARTTLGATVTGAALFTAADAAAARTAVGATVTGSAVLTAADAAAARTAIGVDVNPVKAWVNFNGVPASGTYSRTGTLVTVTLTAHGMTTGMIANLDFTTGTATDGNYAVTVVDPNTFTVTDSASGTTSGNVTRNCYIRTGLNVASVTDNGTGDFTVNFTSALPSADYALSGTARETGGGSSVNYIAVRTYAAGSARFFVANQNGAVVDPDVITIMVVQ